MSGCGEGAEWVEQLRAPRQGHCTSQSQPVKATLLRRAVTLCATVAGWLRRQNGLIWYYLVHDNFFMSGLDWGTIIDNLTQKGWSVSSREYRVNVGSGKYRYPDIIATKNGVTRYYQIGKATKAGRPIARELRALRDLGRVNPVYFVRYN